MMEQGYETFFYETKNENKRKFAVVKLNPSVCVMKCLPNVKIVRSGYFQFIITDEEKYNEAMAEVEKLIKSKLRRRKRFARKLISLLDDILAGALIDGLTFEISIERGLYLSKLIEKLVEEDFDHQREIRNQIMFEEQYLSKDRDMSVL